MSGCIQQVNPNNLGIVVIRLWAMNIYKLRIYRNKSSEDLHGRNRSGGARKGRESREQRSSASLLDIVVGETRRKDWCTIEGLGGGDDIGAVNQSAVILAECGDGIEDKLEVVRKLGLII